jgi:hypothetical protein
MSDCPIGLSVFFCEKKVSKVSKEAGLARLGEVSSFCGDGKQLFSWNKDDFFALSLLMSLRQISE